MDRNIDTLVETFSQLAEESEGELVDDSETMGEWEWFEFGGLSPEQVRNIAAQIIVNHSEIKFADQAPGGNDFIEGEHVVVVL